MTNHTDNATIYHGIIINYLINQQNWLFANNGKNDWQIFQRIKMMMIIIISCIGCFFSITHKKWNTMSSPSLPINHIYLNNQKALLQERYNDLASWLSCPEKIQNFNFSHNYWSLTKVLFFFFFFLRSYSTLNDSSGIYSRRLGRPYR